MSCPGTRAPVPVVVFYETNLGPGGVHLTGLGFLPTRGTCAATPTSLSLSGGDRGGALGRAGRPSRVAPLCSIPAVDAQAQPPQLVDERIPFFLGVLGAGAYMVDLVLDVSVLRDVWIQRF